MYPVFGDVKDKLVFDCGANVGEFTQYFTSRGAKVIAIEPQAELTVNNPKFDGAIIENVCISDTEGYLNLYECDANTIATCSTDWKDKGRFKGSPWTKSRTVQATTLDALIHKYGKPSIIKMDVEGFENVALRGLSERVDIISFEFTQEFTDKALDCLTRLETLGFKQIYAYPWNKVEGQIFFGPFFDSARAYLKQLPSGDMGDFVLL